jgi:phosphate acetyltransferase
LAADGIATVAFGDAHDGRMLEAVRDLTATGLVQPVVIEPPADAKLPASVQVVSVDDPQWSQRCADEFTALRHARGAEVGDARAAVRDPLLFMALYARLGGADAGVAGSMSTSARVIRAGLLGLGTAHPGALVSGCFVMTRAERVITYADASVNPQPTAEQLAVIAADTADCHRRITGEEPRVAMLSFSSYGSAQHPDVDKVRRAVALVRQQRPDLVVDGEIQFDAAIDPEIGQRKAPGSVVAGYANVFIFPDLDAANIGYKISERLAGFTATGSFVLGLSKPWVDLSRGCTSSDVVNAAIAAGRMVTEGAVT